MVIGGLAMGERDDSNMIITDQVIQLIHDLVDVRGSDGMAFYTRLEIRRKIREKLAELDCSEDITSGASH